jgi:hypothetical protein
MGERKWPGGDAYEGIIKRERTETNKRWEK